MRDEETEDHCRHIQVLDFVDRSSISAKVMSMIAYEPRLKYMLEDVVSGNSTMNFTFRNLSDYLHGFNNVDLLCQVDVHMSFFDLQKLALRSDELLLGWTQCEEECVKHCWNNSSIQVPQVKSQRLSAQMERLARDAGAHVEPGKMWSYQFYDMNPEDKSKPRWLNLLHDKLIVLCKNAP